MAVSLGKGVVDTAAHTKLHSSRFGLLESAGTFSGTVRMHRLIKLSGRRGLAPCIRMRLRACTPLAYLRRILLFLFLRRACQKRPMLCLAALTDCIEFSLLREQLLLHNFLTMWTASALTERLVATGAEHTGGGIPASWGNHIRSFQCLLGSFGIARVNPK